MEQTDTGCFTIKDVHVIDGTDKPSGGKDVVIRDGRIATITETSSEARPIGHVIEGRAGFLVPGLWESHTHVLMLAEGHHAEQVDTVRKTLCDYAKRGITSVVDLGGSIDVFSEVRETVSAAPQRAANFYFAGPVFTGVDGWPLCLHHDHSLALEIDDPSQVEPLVAGLEGRTDFIKVIYDGVPGGNDKLPRAALNAVIGASRRHGKRVMVHIRSADDITEALAAGADCIEHCPIPKDPTSLEEAKRAADLLASSQAFYCPTLVAWEQIARSGDIGYLSELESAGVLTSAECEHYASQPSFGRPFPRHGADECHMRLEYGIWTLELMRSAGVSIVAGSDVAIHMSRPAALFRELQLLSEGGLSNVEAVRSATTMAAARLGHPADVGRLTIGAPADAILLDRDPLESLDHLVRPEHLRAVFRHGERLDA